MLDDWLGAVKALLKGRLSEFLFENVLMVKFLRRESET